MEFLMFFFFESWLLSALTTFFGLQEVSMLLNSFLALRVPCAEWVMSHARLLCEVHGMC